MPNRILKESICTSESINMLSPFEETVFYRLIVNCDDFGRFDGRAAIIRARLFPLKSVTDKQVDDAVEKLRTVGMVVRYEVDGKAYIQLAAWDSHQQRRAQKSKYPSPAADTSLAGAINCNQLQSDALVFENENENEYPPYPPAGGQRKERKTKKETERAVLVGIIHAETPSAEVQKAAIGWLDMRIAKNKTPTESAVQLAFKKLRGMTSDADEAVAIFEQSILNCWAGLFPLKEGKT